jgi:hypothetical protein
MQVVGSSGTPLYKKLGMKAGALWKTVNAPDGYMDLLGEARDVAFVQAKADLDGIHVFTNQIDEVEAFMKKCSLQIKKNGCLWFSWYKKSAKLPTEVTEDIIRDTALALGLVDVKVCAIDHEWSALKIVWRVENR